MLLLALLACQSPGPTPAAPAPAIWGQITAVGALLTDDPGLVDGGPEGLVIAPIASDPAVVSALEGRDERAAAAALREHGAHYLLLHRERAEGRDRGASVIARLYFGDDRRWFALKAADGQRLLYEVREHPAEVSPGEARVGVERVRTRLEGREPTALRLTGAGPWDLLATLRREGGEVLVSASCADEDYGACLDALAVGLREGWPEEGPLAAVAGELILDLYFVTEQAAVLDPEVLELSWEPGVDGLRLGRGPGTQAAPGSWAFTLGCQEAGCLLDALGGGGGEPLWLLRDVHYQDRPGAGVVAMERGVPALPLPLVALGAAGSALELAEGWYAARGEVPPQPAEVSAAAYESVDGSRGLRCDAPDLERWVPEAVAAAAARYRQTGEAQAAERGLELARSLVDRCLWTADNAPWPDYVGGYRGRDRVPSARSLRLALAAAEAYALALSARPAEAPGFEAAARSSVRFGMQLQYDEGQRYAAGAEVLGGLRAAPTAPGVDGAATGTFVSLLTRYLEAAQADPDLPESVRLSPIRGLLIDVGRGPSEGD